MAKMNQFKDVNLVYDAPSGLTLYLYADGSASPARTLTFPASTGTRAWTEPTDVPGLLEAKTLKFRGTSPGIVRLYGGSIRWRALGVYFDGSNEEVWETQDLAFGA